jgi:hypothetical protein
LVTWLTGSLDFPFDLFDTGSLEQQPGRVWCAYVEGERAIGADRNPGWNRDAGGDMSCTGIELLLKSELDSLCRLPCSHTLQKSILLTPLLPSAGPTGGLGLA